MFYSVKNKEEKRWVNGFKIYADIQAWHGVCHGRRPGIVTHLPRRPSSEAARQKETITKREKEDIVLE